ncbi:MAG: hypothetical protein ACRCSP_09270, partial [Rhodoglobus sp.]
MTAQPTPFALLREAILNISSHPFRSAVTILISITAGACVIGATATNVDAIVQADRVQQLRGLSTLSVTSLDGNPLSAAQCDAVGDVGSVKAAGGTIRSVTVATPNSATPVTIRYVTHGFLAVAYPQEKLQGVSSIAGSDLGTDIGLTVGSTFIFTTASGQDGLQIEAVASQRSRTEGINRDVLVSIAPSGEVAECLVEAAPGQV